MTSRQLARRVGAFGLSLAVLLPTVALAQVTADSLPPKELNPGGGETDVRIIVGRIIQTAMSLLGLIAVIIVLYGGFTWMTAGGNEEKVGSAKKILTAGLIGLIIIGLAYGIATFVISSLVSATQG